MSREKLVKASDYDVAVKLAVDLHDVATRNATADSFTNASRRYASGNCGAGGSSTDGSART
jgi:hypothetical protein